VELKLDIDCCWQKKLMTKKGRTIPLTQKAPEATACKLVILVSFGTILLSGVHG